MTTGQRRAGEKSILFTSAWPIARFTRVAPQVGVSPFGGSRASVLDLARRAAACRLDGLTLGDGFVRTPSFPVWSGGLDCFVELAWLAGHVDLPTYGVDAVVAPARDPRVLAKQASSLQAVTDGRTHLALSAGFWPDDARLFGYSFEERGARLDEAIAGLIAASKGMHFTGRFWSWETALPISPAHEVALPELWLSGGVATMRRALRHGVTWQPTGMTPEQLAPLAREYADSGGVGLSVRTRMSVSQPPSNPDAVAFRNFPTLVGPAEYLAERVADYAAVGATYISVVPGYDDRSCAETIEALGRARELLTGT
jgi:alkanesulfonate monooxygenase SsuD/methylene tetrahydromethanopterin reductase-like flavin-dependent oxidoreductase (luciferase family)